METVRSLANHPTAEEIYEAIVQTQPSISKGTVYRNLNSLVEDGQLLKIGVPDGADRFDHNEKIHYHIQCAVCGAFVDVDTAYMTDIDSRVEAITDIRLPVTILSLRVSAPIAGKGNEQLPASWIHQDNTSDSQ